MVRGTSLLVGLLVIAALSGCSKKSKQITDKEFSRVPAGNEQTAKPADTGDIFDQFYQEDEGKAVKPSQKKEKQSQTFSASGSSSYAPRFVEGGRYVVQISTVRSRQFADNLSSKLNANGYPAYVAEVQNPTPVLSGTYYRIRIGAFNIVATAREFGENILKPNGYDYWIDNKSNDNVGIDGAGLGTPTGTYQSTPSSTSSWGSGSTGSSTTTSGSSWGSSPSTSTPAYDNSTSTSSTTTPASGSTYTPPPATAPAAAPSSTTSGSSSSSGWDSDTSSGW